MSKPSRIGAQRELEQCQNRCEELRHEINELRATTGTRLLTELAGNKNVQHYEPVKRKDCSGHFGKIYALHWGPDSRHIITASQDGKLIIWNSVSGNKQLAITLNSAWVMTCAFSPSYDYVASGGLDNTVSIYKISNTEAPDNTGRFKNRTIWRELEKHDGYLSCARFINDNSIISASGDSTCILWDVESRTATRTFMDHTGDVMYIALNNLNNKLFVSGSVDATAKVWDRSASERCIANFPGHQSDINTVEWFPDGQAIVTGSDDGTVRLFDMRSYRQLNEYYDAENRTLHSQDPAGVTSVDVSATGQYIFAGMCLCFFCFLFFVFILRNCVKNFVLF